MITLTFALALVKETTYTEVYINRKYIHFIAACHILQAAPTCIITSLATIPYQRYMQNYQPKLVRFHLLCIVFYQVLKNFTH